MARPHPPRVPVAAARRSIRLVASVASPRSTAARNRSPSASRPGSHAAPVVSLALTTVARALRCSRLATSPGCRHVLGLAVVRSRQEQVDDRPILMRRSRRAAKTGCRFRRDAQRDAPPSDRRARRSASRPQLRRIDASAPELLDRLGRTYRSHRSFWNSPRSSVASTIVPPHRIPSAPHG